MLLPVMRNGTFCTTTIERKKRGKIPHFRACAEHTSGHVTDVTSGSYGVTSGHACTMARSPLIPPKCDLNRPDILLKHVFSNQFG